MHIARVSMGKISDTVRYAELAPAEAKKKITHQQAVCDVAVSVPFLKRIAVTMRSSPEMMYVPAIIGLRPTLSKKRPSRSGPAKLPTANGSRYRPTLLEPTP